jgi:hypothetical protein
MSGNVNCREASRLLSQANERSLTEAEAAALRFHLDRCGMCREFGSQLEFLKKAAARFRTGD